ncbi:MAG: lysophospholipid acyltransferase family protein [Desulfobacterales bacterium]|nr:lysophospholipid acyltransferase family protein [Desulfobacterales bacterium]
MHSVFHDLVVRLLRGFFLLLGAVPRRRAADLADLLGRLWYKLDARHRKVALWNLSQAFGGETTAGQRELLAKKAFSNLMRIPFEIGWSMKWKEQDCLRYFDIEGKERIQAARQKGKGLLILTGHMGNWELLPPMVLMLGTPATTTYRPVKFAPADAFFLQMRSRFGSRMVPKKKAMRKILRAMAKKECVCMLFDQTSRRDNGAFVEFFGRKAWTNTGPALLALKTGAPVLPAFIIRDGDRFRVEIGEEIPLIKSGDKAKDVLDNTARYNKAIENVIRRHPEQWFWVHNRWKERSSSKRR